MTGSPGPGLSRRALIGTGLGVGAAAFTAAGSGAARAADRTPLGAGSAQRGAYAFLAAAMDAYPDHGTVRLAQSYTDQAGLFSTAFTYDNADAQVHLLRIAAELLRRGGALRLPVLAELIGGGRARIPLYPFERRRNHVVRDEIDPVDGITDAVPVSSLESIQ